MSSTDEQGSNSGAFGATGARSYTSLNKTISVVCDSDAFDYHIDAHPGYRPADLRQALAQMRQWGLQPMPWAEDDASEQLDDGTVRIWCEFIESLPEEWGLDLSAPLRPVA